MPPPTTTRSELKSMSPNPGVLRSPANIVFTPVSRLNRYFDISFTKPGMSRGFVISTFSPPCAMPSRQFPCNEKM